MVRPKRRWFLRSCHSEPNAALVAFGLAHQPRSFLELPILPTGVLLPRAFTSNPMTRPAKKVKELERLLVFQKLCLECPRSKPSQPEPPAPDIIFAKCNLGIEITEYSLGQGKDGSLPRQLESIRQRIICAAQIKYELTSKRWIQVTIMWANDQCPAKKEEKNIAQEIARLVTDQHFQNARGFHIDWEEFESPLLQKFIASIGVMLIGPQEGQSCWSSKSALCPGEAAPRIQVALDEKESKVAEYRKYCQNLWLLIIADANYFTSWFSQDKKLQCATFNSSFDRVFLLDEVRNSIHEFKVESCVKRQLPTVLDRAFKGES
jgi:hypothetical protein